MIASSSPTVIIDSVALLKIINHCSQPGSAANTGALLGIEVRMEEGSVFDPMMVH